MSCTYRLSLHLIIFKSFDCL